MGVRVMTVMKVMSATRAAWARGLLLDQACALARLHDADSQVPEDWLSCSIGGFSADAVCGDGSR